MIRRKQEVNPPRFRKAFGCPAVSGLKGVLLAVCTWKRKSPNSEE
jgi:hypothetical protein